MTSTAPSPARTGHPLYKEVKQRIVDGLHQGRWQRGRKIASEAQLAARHGVSVGTIRRAVGELVAENVLVREQGRGTFVVSHTADYMLNIFFRIVDRDGKKELPTVATISMRRARADRETARSLHLKARAPVFEIESVLSFGGRPTIYDRMRLPASLFPDLTERVFAARDGTVYGLFQRRFGITVVRMEEFVTAVSAGEREARLLGVAPGAALLRVHRTAFTYKGEPVDWRVRLVDPTRHGYLSVLGSS